VVARHHGHAGFECDALGLDLGAHAPDRLARGPDEGDARGFTSLDQRETFGQKAVAGVDGLRPTRARRRDNGRSVEVAARGLGRAYAHRRVAGVHVQRVAVGVGIHRHRAQAHAPRSARDAAGDFTAVGDQQGIKQGELPR
jgi:hypothetical protein